MADGLLIEDDLCKMMIVVGGGSEEGASGSRHACASVVQLLSFATPRSFPNRLQASVNIDIRRVRCVRMPGGVCVLT